MGGQLVFDWDRLENFLTTRDQSVGNHRRSQGGERILVNVVILWFERRFSIQNSVIA